MTPLYQILFEDYHTSNLKHLTMDGDISTYISLAKPLTFHSGRNMDLQH